MGGTFGAVINSIFPALAGFGVGVKDNNNHEKIHEKKVEETVDKAIEITHSDAL